MSRNTDVKKILSSREIARKQNLEQKRRSRVGTLQDGYCRSAVWPTNKRVDKNV